MYQKIVLIAGLDTLGVTILLSLLQKVSIFPKYGGLTLDNKLLHPF